MHNPALYTKFAKQIFRNPFPTCPTMYICISFYFFVLFEK